MKEERKDVGEEEGWAEIRTFGSLSTGYKRPGLCVELCHRKRNSTENLTTGSMCQAAVPVGTPATGSGDMTVPANPNRIMFLDLSAQKQNLKGQVVELGFFGRSAAFQAISLSHTNEQGEAQKR
jgi:hypothetical protein